MNLLYLIYVVYRNHCKLYHRNVKNYPIYVNRPIELDDSIYDAVVRIHTYLVRNIMGGLTIHILENLSLRTVRNERFNTQKIKEII